MARVTQEQAEQLSQRNKRWFKLEDDGDIALIQFPYEGPGDVDHLTVHTIPIEGRDYGRSCDCLRQPEDPIDDCPLCAAGFTTKVINILKFYNHTTGKVEFWERSNKFVQRKLAKMNTVNPEDFPYAVWQIQRFGKAKSMDTTYEIDLYSRGEPIEWSDLEPDENPDPVGCVVQSATASEMDVYLATGKFPDSDDGGSERPAPRQQAAQRRPAPVNRPTGRPQAAPPSAAQRRPAAQQGQAPSSRGGRSGRAPRGNGEDQF